MRQRFGRRWCASRRRTGGTRSTCCNCCGKIAFRRFGCRVWRRAMCGSCWCIGTSKVQARTRTRNQLQAMALSQGVQKKWKLWTKAGRAELEQLPLLPYAAERRKQLLQALDHLAAEIAELNGGVEEEVRKRPEAVRLRTHPGVGPVTALAMVLTLGRAGGC